ncbi:MAG: hypothetical protein IBJ10_01625 [Phycisphaerales bacterium]|nr:hypothetical protein [Phycisphaerales bacterium]
MGKPLNLDSLKPGAAVTLVVNECPLVENHVQTIERLMRQDPDMKRGLKKGQHDRMQRLVVRSRGGRPWEKRELSSKIVRCEKGAKWSMTYFPQIANDLASVARYLGQA